MTPFGFSSLRSSRQAPSGSASVVQHAAGIDHVEAPFDCGELENIGLRELNFAREPWRRAAFGAGEAR